jgi:uncharacterized protein YecE (DUF72 family)
MSDAQAGVYWKWRDSFYGGVRQEHWFEHYLKRLDTVEINASFYSWPTVCVIADILGERMGCFLFQLPRSYRSTRGRLDAIQRNSKSRGFQRDAFQRSGSEISTNRR